MEKLRLGSCGLEVEENFGAADLALAEDLAPIGAAVSQVTIQGSRFPAELNARVGR